MDPTPDTPTPPRAASLPAPVAHGLAILGAAVASAAAVLPWPEATTPTLLVGFLAASLGGLAAKPPELVEGKPLVQGAWFTVAAVAAAVLASVYPQVPTGWPQALALFGAGLLAWAAGKPLPHLGATTNVRLEAPAPTPPGGTP